jgi:hypothetical protein
MSADELAGPTSSPLPQPVREKIRETIEMPMRYHCAREGKVMYIDKSLDSVFHLDAVEQFFPETPMVLAFRHGMDAVASGIEASPWGFQAYGYQSSMQNFGTNFVAGLTQHWVTQVEGALLWEKQHPTHCLRVHYEALVTEPRETVERMFDFLGVARDLGVLDRVFHRAHRAFGPGDHKIGYTAKFETASLGKGRRVPVKLIPDDLLERMNACLRALGYREVDEGWNASPDPWDGTDAELESDLEVAMVARMRKPPSPGGSNVLAALIVEDRPAQRWVVDVKDGTVRRAQDGIEPDVVLAGREGDLLALFDTNENPGVLFRTGRVRVVPKDDSWTTEALNAAVRVIVSVMAAS